jgi:hypothetical protein
LNIKRLNILEKTEKNLKKETEGGRVLKKKKKKKKSINLFEMNKKTLLN